LKKNIHIYASEFINVIKSHLLYNIFLLVFPAVTFCQLVPREKMAKMEKEFDPFPITGMTWNQFGDLVIEKKGKFYWLSTFSNVQYEPYDYFRLFELDFENGQMIEVTKKMLGGHYRVEIGRVPYYYEDIDNDGIKDIFVFDIGQELLSVPPQNWNYYNTFFKGTDSGFVKTDIPIITTVERYHHAHSIRDFDNDGDLDIAFSADYPRIFLNDGKGNFSEMTISNLKNPPNDGRLLFLINGRYYNSGSFSMKFTNLDDDPELEILFPVHNRPIFLDYINGEWQAKLFGEEKAFIFKENIHIGVEDILEIPAQSKNDLFFRIATFDTIVNGNGSPKWLTKFFYSKSKEIDKVKEFKNTFLASNSCFYLDPKLVDLNFDGYPDLFFKEDEFWGNTGEQLHTIDQRIWINDGTNEFEPIKLKFNQQTRNLVYAHAKTDTLLKTSIFFSQRRVPIDKNGVFTNDRAFLYNRFDTLVFPINRRIVKNICVDSSFYEKLTMTPINFKLVSTTQESKISFDRFGISYFASKAGIDTVRYQIYNDFFESEIYQLIITRNEKPVKPSISWNGSELSIPATYTTYQWLLNNTVIAGATSASYKPVNAGLHRIRVTNSSGCADTSDAFNLVVTAAGRVTQNPNKVSVYPNPATSSVFIDLGKSPSQPVSVQLLTIEGRPIANWIMQQQRQEFAIDHIQNGTYLIQIVEGKTRTIHKVVIQTP